MRHIGVAEGNKLFEVVLHFQVILINRLLPDDAVEEVTRRRKMAAGRDAGVATRIDVQATAGGRRRGKIARHEQFLPPWRPPFLPMLIVKAENIGGRQHGGRVKAQRISQVRLDVPKHLIRLDDDDRMIRQSIVLPQRGHAGDVHTRHRRRTEIHWHAIRLAVGQHGANPFSTGHRIGAFNRVTSSLQGCKPYSSGRKRERSASASCRAMNSD